MTLVAVEKLVDSVQENTPELARLRNEVERLEGVVNTLSTSHLSELERLEQAMSKHTR